MDRQSAVPSMLLDAVADLLICPLHGFNGILQWADFLLECTTKMSYGQDYNEIMDARQ